MWVDREAPRHGTDAGEEPGAVLRGRAGAQTATTSTDTHDHAADDGDIDGLRGVQERRRRASGNRAPRACETRHTRTRRRLEGGWTDGTVRAASDPGCSDAARERKGREAMPHPGGGAAATRHTDPTTRRRRPRAAAPDREDTEPGGASRMRQERFGRGGPSGRPAARSDAPGHARRGHGAATTRRDAGRGRAGRHDAASTETRSAEVPPPGGWRGSPRPGVSRSHWHDIGASRRAPPRWTDSPR